MNKLISCINIRDDINGHTCVFMCELIIDLGKFSEMIYTTDSFKSWTYIKIYYSYISLYMRRILCIKIYLMYLYHIKMYYRCILKIFVRYVADVSLYMPMIQIFKLSNTRASNRPFSRTIFLAIPTRESSHADDVFGDTSNHRTAGNTG